MKVEYIGEGSPMTCTNGRVYDVMSIENGWYRVMDDTEEDYIYPAESFKIVEPNPPAPILA